MVAPARQAAAALAPPADRASLTEASGPITYLGRMGPLSAAAGRDSAVVAVADLVLHALSLDRKNTCYTTYRSLSYSESVSTTSEVCKQISKLVTALFFLLLGFLDFLDF